MAEFKDKAFPKLDVRENTKSQSRDGSLGSGSTTVLKDGEEAAFANGEDAIGPKTAASNSETSSAKEPGKAITGSKLDISSSEVISGSKISDASSPNGKVKCLKRADVLSPPGEVKIMSLQPALNFDQTESSGIFRLPASENEAISLSPGGEIKCPNKRPAVICDFYSKGWCIKGSSCRFLHVKDHQKKKDLVQQVRDIPADSKSDLQLEGLRETSPGSGSPSARDLLAAAVGNKSGVPLSRISDIIQPREIAESKGFSHIPEMPKFLQREEFFPLPIKGTGSDIKRKNVFPNEHREHGSISLNHRFGNPPSCSPSVEELARFQNQHPHGYPIPPLARDLINMPLSNSVSTWTGSSSLPFSYSSLSTSQIGSRPSTSLLPFPSQVPGCKPDNLAPTKRKISVDDWEPSVPFRPSILLRSLVSLPEIEYDPLHDSIELPKPGDVSLKASFYCQGSSILNMPSIQNNAETVSENRCIASNDDTMSVSSHNAHKEKDSRTSKVEVMGTSFGGESNALANREMSLGSVVKDNTYKTSNYRNRNHGHRDSLGVKVDNIRQHNRMDVGHISEQTVNKESKALRQFRAALIEFVKESLKPKWLEGRLSKDIHNKIVKKAVEKVLSTLPIEQVPTSLELTNRYLTLSRSKIDKLVEGYAELYARA